MTEYDREAFEQFERSAIVSTLESAGGKLSASANQSRVVTTARQYVDEFLAVPLAIRIRMTGVFVLAMIATHEAMAAFVPPRLASAIPGALPLVVAAAAAFVIAWAPQLATAWETRQSPAERRQAPD
jgi:hypothetical protein